MEKKPTIIEYVLAFLLAAVLGLFVAGVANGQPICPDGSQVAYEVEGHYTLYPPNPPAAYTRILMVSDDGSSVEIIDSPPPGQYFGDHIYVCYDPYAIPEIVIGCDGLPMADGTCMTIERYNEVFSVEALERVESLTTPGRSVAQVYHLSAFPPVAAADRPRLDGEPTFREVIEGRLWAL
jgi:hypothetical protein